jgi:hypothetical protein
VDAAARKRQREFIRGPYAELEVDAGHWLIEEQEAQVVDAILSHLRRVDTRETSAAVEAEATE